MRERLGDTNFNRIPSWVPTYAVRYLAHTEKGVSIRELARQSNCHASTIMRQIRRIETRREDPLIDAALATLGAQVAPEAINSPPQRDAGKPDAFEPPASDDTLERVGVEILSGLSHGGAVLVVKPDVDKAVVVRDGLSGHPQRTVVLDRSVAEAMALKDWISCKSKNRVSQYVITPEGRSALQRMMARRENSAQGFAEAQPQFEQEAPDAAQSLARVRFHTSESPLAVLARRRDKDGKPFISRDLVRAGERLREDFELAHLAPNISKDWETMRHDREPCVGAISSKTAPIAAKQRVQAALETLGEGLADVVLRCCCYLEGMELTEKRMGWPARSGKVVLRIALMRLNAFYQSQERDSGSLIW